MTFTVKGKKVGTVVLSRGVATLKVTVPKGATTVVATFVPTGSAAVAGSSRTATRSVRVRSSSRLRPPSLLGAGAGLRSVAGTVLLRRCSPVG